MCDFAAEIRRVLVGEVVDVDKRAVIGAEGPGGFEHFKPFFRLDTQVVLFHGLELIASAFPHSTVAIIKNMKSLLIWKLGLGFDVAHGNNLRLGF